MSNSSLVTYTKFSPNKTSPRNNKIDMVIIHCYVGQVTAKQGCDNFAISNNSANYVVGKDGSIGLSVDEKDRAWTSGGKDKNGNVIRVNGISGADIDHRAVTIEVASDTTHPYKVTDAAYKSLINLLVDICQRNNIKELKWKADKSLVGKVDKQNMAVHRWFAIKACPGDYLYNLHDEIASEVNAKLNNSNTSNEKEETPKTLYRVQVGAFTVLKYAQNHEAKVRAAGFDTYLVKVGKYYKVQVGAFSKKANVEAMLQKVKKAGFDCFITTEVGTPVTSTPSDTIKEGSKVKVKKGAKTYTGGSIASFVYNKVYTVDELSGDRAVLDKKGICTPVNVQDLILQ